MKLSRRLILIMVGYSAWIAVFPIVMSPIVLGVLSFSEMGFRLDTALQGLVLGFLVCLLFGVGELLPINIRKRMLKDVRTTKQFDEMWKVQMIGGYDGVIAESHWSGTVIPLSVKLFSGLGLIFPIAFFFSVALRWVLHVAAHFFFPSNEEGNKYYGNFLFTALGLLLLDIVNSIVFVASGNVLAPVVVHTFMQPVAQLVGVKRKLAKELDLEPDTAKNASG